jgi:hypothetical protein
MEIHVLTTESATDNDGGETLVSKSLKENSR